MRNKVRLPPKPRATLTLNSLHQTPKMIPKDVQVVDTESSADALFIYLLSIFRSPSSLTEYCMDCA